MTAAFDTYRDSYGDVVQRSIAFSGLTHDLFLRAKALLLAEIFAAHFGSAPPALLDIGCGVGLLHDHLAPLTRSLAGCDLSGECIETARLRRPETTYRRQEDPGALPWEDRAFDASLAVCVFHHVVPGGRDRLLGEMARVTRRGGLVIVIEHNPLNPLTRLAVARCPFDDDAELLGAGTARALLRRGGLHGIASRFFLLAPSTAGWALRAERPFRRLPLGAQYAAYGEV